LSSPRLPPLWKIFAASPLSASHRLRHHRLVRSPSTNSQLRRSSRLRLLYGPNFSVGVNLFFQIVARAATLLSNHSEYEAWGWEIHHSAKKDAPSGTLKKLADEIRAAGYSGPLNLAANRAGSHTGTHEVGFDSPADTITLRHTARSREGYATAPSKQPAGCSKKKASTNFAKLSRTRSSRGFRVVAGL